MNSLVTIDERADSALLARHRIRHLPVLVVFPHNQCNCRCVMCDIWRIREAREIASSDLERQMQSFRELGVGWVVFSGGEPQLNEQWSTLAQMVRAIGCRVTLLTAGLLLKAQARAVVQSVDDVIVSLDGPPDVHNRIRRVRNAFEQIAEGIEELRRLRPDLPVRARCTVQKFNHTSLREAVRSAKNIGLSSISFLAADLTSSAFNRPEAWKPDRSAGVALTAQEADELEQEIESLIEQNASDISSGFVVESAAKLQRVVRHFRAHLGQAAAIAPRCNAPWVSAVVEAAGDVRPCFFHPVLGNIHQQPFEEILNGARGLQFRASLDVETNPTCRNCVCSLHLAQPAADKLGAAEPARDSQPSLPHPLIA